MKPEYKSIIKNSWSKLALNATKLGSLLYPKLFAKDPKLKDLFAKNNAGDEQARQLFMVISLTVSKIDKLENLKEELKALSKRHVKYGVKPEHFTLFGEAFMESIDELFSNEKESKLREAWQSLYQEVATSMIADMTSLN
jgi:nitric oxide dioxygenase